MKHYMAHLAVPAPSAGRPACRKTPCVLPHWRIWREFYQCHHDAHRLLPVLVTLSAHAEFTHRGISLTARHCRYSLVITGDGSRLAIRPKSNRPNPSEEAAYRKELVYGEDDASRATPPSPSVNPFSAVRHNYSSLISLIRASTSRAFSYLQVDNVFGLFLLFPSIAAVTPADDATNVARARFVPVFD